MSVTAYGWLVLAFPLGGSILIALAYKALPPRALGIIGTLAILFSFLAAVGMFVKLQDLGSEHKQVVSVGWNYANTVGIDAKIAILIDPLSTLMCLSVASVSMLIHLYSVAYMGGDRGYPRFFAFMNFFVFSMLLLVLASNFFLLIVGWAFVGAASYFLISFWYRRKTATDAGIKAFVINVLGDAGLVLGTYFIFRGVHTLDFLQTFDRLDGAFTVNEPSLVAGCVLLLVGAFAKSAQIPLHTWLPDAMEGPTPVSALIHAATMVTAGVYLIARLHPLFERAPDAAAVGAVVGCVTLLVAATIGLAVTDLKRVIAYSTMSQIGYMIMGVSSAAYAAGMFHLMTHAFFKALLFMAAGSVISAMGGIQDLNRMSGFRKAMPFTFAMFIIGGLALSGVPPFSGAFSKDEILSLEFARGGWHSVLGVIGYLAAFMTAIYTFRMIFRAFTGDPCPEAQELEHGHLYHPPEPINPANGEIEDTDVGFPGPEHAIAEREGAMKVAMGMLAILATFGGFLQIPGVDEAIHKFLEPTFADSQLYSSLEPGTGTQWLELVIGGVIGLAGIGVAWRLWGDGRRPELASRFGALHTFFVNKWYFDEIIDFLVVRPVAWLGRFCHGAVERVLVQGALVGGASGTVRALSAAVRGVQTGYLRYYAALLLVGLTALGAYFLVSA